MKSITLKVKGTKKKAKWTSGNKKIATVTQKGKVTAKSAGTTKITAKIAKKKYSCTVTVTDSNTVNPAPTPTVAPTKEPTEPTPAPTQEPTDEPAQESTEPAVSNNFEKLKTYIMNEGSVDDDGFYTITMSNSEEAYTIGYIEVDGGSVFSFSSLYINDNATYMDTSYMIMKPLDIQTVTFTSDFYLLADSSYRYRAKTDIAPKDFVKDTMYVFEVVDNTSGIENSTIQAFENFRMSDCFSAWETLLSKAGLSWADLGFTAY